MATDLVELTVWFHENYGRQDGFSQHLEAEIALRGGPADPGPVRDWLQQRAAQREREAARHEKPVVLEPGQPRWWIRVGRCPCGGETTQLLHGYTASGRLWKGHACACDGWQCDTCGRILDRVSSCCR